MDKKTLESHKMKFAHLDVIKAQNGEPPKVKVSHQEIFGGKQKRNAKTRSKRNTKNNRTKADTTVQESAKTMVATQRAAAQGQKI